MIGRALELSPPQARLHNLKGQAHLRQNADDDALTAFGRAIEVDPAFADAYGNRGTLLSEMGRAAEALTDFDRALELRPNNPEDHCNRASAMADMGQLDEALQVHPRDRADAGDGAGLFQPRRVLMRLGRPAEALRDSTGRSGFIRRWRRRTASAGLAAGRRR